MQTFDATQEEVQSGKVYSILSYIGFLFLVPLLAAKDNKYARYHCNQGIALFILGVVFSVIATVLNFVGGLAGIGILIIVGSLISWVGSIVCLVFMIMGIVNAAQGKVKPLPVIGGISILK